MINNMPVFIASNSVWAKSLRRETFPLLEMILRLNLGQPLLIEPLPIFSKNAE